MADKLDLGVRVNGEVEVKESAIRVIVRQNTLTLEAVLWSDAPAPLPTPPSPDSDEWIGEITPDRFPANPNGYEPIMVDKVPMHEMTAHEPGKVADYFPLI